MTWHPIETAPKDGTRIDVWVLHTYLDYPKSWLVPSSGHRVADAWWEVGQWVETGQYDDTDPLEGESHHGWVASVTHWMPLPEPPPANVAP